MLITEVHNPIRQFRRAHNLTQVELARISGVTPQIILRTEQGLFSTIPMNLLAAIAKGRTQEDAALRHYQQWIIQERSTREIPESLIFETPQGIPILTFTNMKKYYKSLTAVAKFLVIQISMVQEFEKSHGHRNVTAFRKSLSDIGYKGIFTYE